MGGVADTVGLVGQVMMRTGWRKKGARIETPRRLVMVTAPFTHKCYWPMGHPISRQQCSDALDVKQAEEEHAHVQGAQEQQHGKEHADQAHDDHLALKVDNEHHTADPAAQSDGCNQDQHLPHGHDAVVAKYVEDGDVPVDYNGQEVTDGKHQVDADHGVKDVVHVLTQRSNLCLLSLLHWQADSLPLNCLLLFSHSVVSKSLQPHGLQHTRLPCPSPSPGAC